jgi:hypothetical protein
VNEARAALHALHISDSPVRWRALGFHVDDHNVARIGGIAVHLGAPGHGITSWQVTGLTAGTTALDGLPTVTTSRAPAPTRATLRHPNQAQSIDHVVISTPDFDRTAHALEQAGIPLRRIANIRGETIRQGFRRLGAAILELVENPSGPPGPATFWGLVIVVPDLSSPHPDLRGHLSAPRPAVQPGRHIATLSHAAGLIPRLAFMDPERRQ